MRWTDWQFWVVTLVMVFAIWRVYRFMRPKRRGPGGGPKRGTRTKLTISAPRRSDDEVKDGR
ncbi:MAG: hypothetical protein KC983_08070 [Phycisphaerales bacterium]|nr:hypothetical protein [Phycisphaerales bacterium]